MRWSRTKANRPEVRKTLDMCLGAKGWLTATFTHLGQADVPRPRPWGV